MFICDMQVCPMECCRILLPALGSENVLKIGFGIKADMERLFATIISLSLYEQPDRIFVVQNVIDICEVIKKYYVEVANKSRQKKSKKPSGMSLSKVCEVVLGKPLDKTLQCSPWSDRPLSLQQLQYASIDSACLVAFMVALEKPENNMYSLLSPSLSHVNLCKNEAFCHIYIPSVYSFEGFDVKKDLKRCKMTGDEILAEVDFSVIAEMGKRVLCSSRTTWLCSLSEAGDSPSGACHNFTRTCTPDLSQLNPSGFASPGGEIDAVEQKHGTEKSSGLLSLIRITSFICS